MFWPAPRPKFRRAFTLIELLVVIVVIGIRWRFSFPLEEAAGRRALSWTPRTSATPSRR